MDPHACYVLRVRGRWAIGGNTFNEIFVFFKFLFNNGLFSFAFLVGDGNITPMIPVYGHGKLNLRTKQ
ncbi:hypothetical protein BRARA_H03010 [Brassica rapa]|uniref:Uncharacterized protein n=1 Tax=Brassica campestris TaxID=3711 RepID=A0A397YKH7_BRACM|nr:hypothetical protein BRARA_H03010 [Brassica rapa]